MRCSMSVSARFMSRRRTIPHRLPARTAQVARLQQGRRRLPVKPPRPVLTPPCREAKSRSRLHASALPWWSPPNDTEVLRTAQVGSRQAGYSRARST